MTPAICVITIAVSMVMGISTAVLIFLTLIDYDVKRMLKGKKVLILALFVDAAFVFAYRYGELALPGYSSACIGRF